MSLADQDSFEDSLPDHLVKWKMVRVPDGEVTIEGKKHEVKDLYFGETEVAWELFDVWALRLDLTQEQQVVGVDAESRPSKPYSVIFTNFGHHGYPAICMSFLNAQGFCEWLSKKTGRHYRLPTEWEWDYACQEEKGVLPGRDESSWHWENGEDVTHPVGKKAPNALGLKDMFRNVAEWCVGRNDERVVKGGSWKTKAADLVFGIREVESPKWNEADPQIPKSKWWLANGQFVGMRLVCDRPGKMEQR